MALATAESWETGLKVGGAHEGYRAKENGCRSLKKLQSSLCASTVGTRTTRTRGLQIDLDVDVGVVLLREILDHVDRPARFGLIGVELILFVALDLVKIDDGKALLLDQIPIGLGHRHLGQPGVDARRIIVIDHIAESRKIGCKKTLFLGAQRSIGSGDLCRRLSSGILGRYRRSGRRGLSRTSLGNRLGPFGFSARAWGWRRRGGTGNKKGEEYDDNGTEQRSFPHLLATIKDLRNSMNEWLEITRNKPLLRP